MRAQRYNFFRKKRIVKSEGYLVYFLYICTLKEHLMSTAVLTKPKRATDSTTTGLSEVAAKEKTATAKKTITSSKIVSYSYA